MEEEDPENQYQTAKFTLLAVINIFAAALYNPGFRVHAENTNYEFAWEKLHGFLVKKTDEKTEVAHFFFSNTHNYLF